MIILKKMGTKKMRLFTILLFSICTIKLVASNPIVPNVGMADPHIFIFNGKAYNFATRDADTKAKMFNMPDWNIWSSSDLVNWTLVRTIKPTETYIGESKFCYATDVAFKNGMYYYYFSNKNINTGVMKSTSPEGPFIDALGKPLLPQDLTTGREYDPTVLVDDDKNHSSYIVFGHNTSTVDSLRYHIAKLNEDMISLAETPKVITFTGDMNGILTENDKPNLHKHNGIYYLSAGADYATSNNVYGPYTRRGSTGNGEHGLTPRAHGNFFTWNNQWFHTWCHFFLGKEVAFYRESYIGYLHYKDNGEMVDDVSFIKDHFATGVGQYDTNWKKIEAEWYMAAENVEKKENSYGGFEIQNIQNNGFLYFPNIKNLEQSKSINFHFSSLNSGIIEVRANSINGPLLGSAIVKNTGSWKKYTNLNCKLKNTTGVQGIYIKFKGKSKDICHLDWFHFAIN